MTENLTACPAELERRELQFIEDAIAVMREAGLSDDRINEALGRRPGRPASATRRPETN